MAAAIFWTCTVLVTLPQDFHRYRRHTEKIHPKIQVIGLVVYEKRKTYITLKLFICFLPTHSIDCMLRKQQEEPFSNILSYEMIWALTCPITLLTAIRRIFTFVYMYHKFCLLKLKNQWISDPIILPVHFLE